MSTIRILTLTTALLWLAGCPDEELPPADDDDVTDDDDDDTFSSDHDFTALVETSEGEVGTVILEFTPTWEGGTVRRFEVSTGSNVTIDGLGHGEYGLLAWLDADGDETWDGIWEGGGEPTARMGITIPRTDLHLVLRRGVPQPILEDDPEWVDLWDVAWDLAADHVAAGTPDNGFADHYLDEAFSEQIFQWDTCFMTLFGRYGLDAYPVMASLDNFYATQADDGYICRVVNESDGLPGGDASDPSEPMINPPLFAWSELLYARQTGDRSRLVDSLGVLDAYHGWIDDNVRTEPGLYYTSMLGSGMDNAPRETAYDGWVDLTAQQAMARSNQAELADLHGSTSMASDCLDEVDRICTDVRDQTWDDGEGFFFDLDEDGGYLTDKTLASIWPLLAGCATDEQAARTLEHLAEPSEFWRVHVFPSTAADSPHYDADGYYWRGGVWAPTTYATITALAEAGRRDLARAAAENHLRALHRVHDQFTPAEGQLSEEAIGDGTNTLWELYAADAYAPGTRWDQTYLGRQDFVGWTGLGPIALLLEQVIGLDADARADTLTWHVGRTDRHGVLDYRFGDQLVDLVAAERGSASAPVSIEVDTTDPFTLVVVMAGRSWSFDVEAGPSTLALDPSASPLAADPVPAGMHPGYAVAGNGSIAAVISDDDGSGDPPGVTHLYRGHFGLDLLDGGRTRVVADGELQSGVRVGLDPFFAAYSELDLPCGGSLAWRTFVGEADVVHLRGVLVAGDSACEVQLFPHLVLRESPHIDDDRAWSTVDVDTGRAALWAELDDGTALAVGSAPAAANWQAGTIGTDGVLAGLTGAVEDGLELALQLSVSAGAGSETAFGWAIATADSSGDALAALDEALAQSAPLDAAAALWAGWTPQALCGGADDLCRVAAANLYAARASSLGGMVPADLTGQFVTDEFPQLYPRDALMVARALQLAGHDDEAWEIVRYWLDADREGPQPGEYWARYDALGRGVDGGTGAEYDVPEWDSNGYLAVLVERLGPEQLSASEQDELIEALDLLVDLQDGDGLWSEGGIVEWVGRLPATTMTNWAGLDAGARLAEGWGLDGHGADYRAAAGRARGGLMLLLDLQRVLLADERDGGLAYDTSMMFGPAWGFPAGAVLDSSLAWILAEATAHGGGVRYFEGMDYGQDLFYFTTSAAAQYAASQGDLTTATQLLEWMTTSSNRYGLAQERIYADGSGAAEATPLSWCAAEVAVALLTLREAEAMAGPPVVDGEVSALEYRRLGPSAVDTDGLDDGVHDPVVMVAAREGDDLFIGLRTAGEIADIPGDSSYAFYITAEDGEGDEPTTDGGAALTFRADPAVTPAASARVRVSPGYGTCVAGPHTGGGFDEVPCGELALGDRAVEVHVSLAALGLTGPAQLIAVTEGADGERLLPAHGSLLTDGGGEPVLVTFEVDAAAVAGQLDPDAGVVVTLSGDRAELGAWLGNAIGLVDDGTMGDEVSGDGIWTTTVEIAERGSVSYKYMVGVAGDGSWDGVEFAGDDRLLWVQDADDTGRVRTEDVFGVMGGFVTDF